MFEDKRLHEVPEPWYSEQTRLNRGTPSLSALLLLIACICYFLLFNRISESIVVLFIAIMATLFPIILITKYLVTNRNGTDNWRLLLPYNQLLYETVLEEVPAMFKRLKIKYSSDIFYELYRVKLDKYQKPLAKSYKVRINSPYYLIFQFGLTVYSIENPQPYKFDMAIRNITMRNLEYAKEFQKEVQQMLKSIEYKEFKEVLK